MWRFPADGQDRVAGDGRARGVVGVADNDDRGLRTDDAQDLVQREPLHPVEVRAPDDERLALCGLVVHGEGRRWNYGFGALLTATSHDEVDALVGAVGEHALLLGYTCVLGDLCLKIAVRRVPLQAALVDVGLQGVRDVRRHGDRALVEVEQSELVRVAALEGRHVGLQRADVRLHHRHPPLQAGLMDRARALRALRARRSIRFAAGGRALGA
mmetsp:Transcript_61948/g.156717  ORF Transcript_61948/g.156717 Transcript_61948/m.156717 type:complete len:213 (+) Transcript_61948:652-1290(+)